MSTLVDVLVTAYRVVIALWNACAVLLQVVWSVMQQAKEEALEVMALLDDGAPMMVSPCQWWVPSSALADRRLHTGRDQVDVVATGYCRHREPVANVDHREGVFVCTPF